MKAWGYKVLENETVYNKLLFANIYEDEPFCVDDRIIHTQTLSRQSRPVIVWPMEFIMKALQKNVRLLFLP